MKLSSPMRSLMAFSRRVPFSAPLANTMAIVSLALTFCSWLTYIGPYRWIAEMQRAMYGVDAVLLSWLLSYLMFVFSVLLLFVAIARVSPDRAASLSKGLETLVTTATVRSHQSHAILIRVFTPRGVVPALLGIAFILMGLSTMGWRKMNSGEETLNISQIVSGARPKAPYLRLRGPVRLVDLRLEYDVQINAGSEKTRYLGAVPSNYQTGDKIVVIVPDRFSPWDPPPRPNSIRKEIFGHAVAEGLPGPVGVHLKNQDLLDQDYFVLDPYSTSSDDRALASFFLEGGLVLICVSLVMSAAVKGFNRLTRRA